MTIYRLAWSDIDRILHLEYAPNATAAKKVVSDAKRAYKAELRKMDVFYRNQQPDFKVTVDRWTGAATTANVIGLLLNRQWRDQGGKV